MVIAIKNKGATNSNHLLSKRKIGKKLKTKSNAIVYMVELCVIAT